MLRHSGPFQAQAHFIHIQVAHLESQTADALQEKENHNFKENKDQSILPRFRLTINFTITGFAI